MKVKQRIELDITGMTNEGNGVGRYDGVAVFVPLATIGDRALVEIEKVGKSFCVGKIIKLITPASSRIKPDCDVFLECGGCAFRHIDYKEELSIKRNFVCDSMSRIGGIKLPSKDIIFGKSEQYRNKAQYPIDKNGKTGFFAVRSHKIIPCENCRLQPAEFSAVTKLCELFIKQYNISVYNEQTGKGLLRHLYIRSAANGDMMIVLVINGKTLPHYEAFVSALLAVFSDKIKSVMLNINREKTNVVLGDECITIYGEDYIEDTLCGVRLRISPLSFYQVNRDMAEKLYLKAAEYADAKDKTIIDLYCGTGAIGLSMAKNAKSVIGVEIVPQAVEDARINAERNEIQNARFICADASAAAKKLRDEGVKSDVVIVDPPRKGCDKQLLSIIADDFSPATIVYVSCDPATLARDCKILEELGYIVKEYTPVDLFPRTTHVETVVCLSREKTVHEMNLNPSPFEKIKSGQKTIELRLYDEKRQRIKEGDVIVFTNTSSGEKMRATVKTLHRFDSFEELYKTLPLLQCGYTVDDVDTAHPSDMEQYYSAKEQKKYGVVGIELFPPKRMTDETVALLKRNV